MATIDLGLLGTDGTTILGFGTADKSGFSVSSVGDVNGDGFDDLIIGAHYADSLVDGNRFSGQSYVIFGDESLPETINLASLGSAGITIFGVDATDFSGWSVSGAGDVNGDGFDDILIGSFAANGSDNSKSEAGESYVVFGAASLPSTIDLAKLGSPGSIGGITIFGADTRDRAGGSISNAGDVNGDGFDDLIIGAELAAALGDAKTFAGESYVIYGAALLPATIDLGNLATLGPTVGITIFGGDAEDRSGRSVSSAGDINGDGFDDLVIGAFRADASGNRTSAAGDSYVIFGVALLPATIDLSNLSKLGATVGITIFGVDSRDYSGRSVSGTGDINGDGFDDLLIGAYTADASGNLKNRAGESYVIFGAASLPAEIDLTNFGTFEPAIGSTFWGSDTDDQSGRSVSKAGDVNGDGFDDLLIGAPLADAAGNAKPDAGESYLIFGAASLPRTIDLANLGELGPTVGLTFFGAEAGDQSGISVSGAGDVNGDGFDDLVIGAFVLNRFRFGQSRADDSYLIFGGNFTNSILSGNLGTNAANKINGTAGAEILNGAGGNDTLIGGGGADVLIGGHGDDVLAIGDSNFQRIVGGNGIDMLRFDGSGLSLNLTAIGNNRIRDVEVIDISGDGDNELILNAAEVLRLSSSTNELKVKLDLSDKLQIGTGWTLQGPKLDSGMYIHRMINGQAKLNIQNATPFQNPFNRFDTNFDGAVGPIDALVIINAIARTGFRELPFADSNEFYFDVTGDNVVAPVDLVQIINFLNLRPGVIGSEGEEQSCDNGLATAFYVDMSMVDLRWLESLDPNITRRRSALRQ